MSNSDRISRAEKANQLLEVIGGLGRQFFSYPKNFGTSRFVVDERGRIWFIDGYTGKKIYLHYKYWQRGFSEGGTLRDLVNRLKDFIMDGRTLTSTQLGLGAWPEYLQNGDLWGYGDDMQRVREAAYALNIIQRKG